MKKQVWFLVAVILIVSMLSVACQPKTVIVQKEVTVERQVEKQVTREVAREVVVEKEVTKVVEKEILPHPRGTPTPAATAVPVYGGTTLPNGQPVDSMFFEQEGANPFIDTEDDHLSTFAMDVDTASYTIVRRYIQDGNLPPQEAVRVEEFVNYFNYNYPEPAEEDGAFAIHIEGAPSPFGLRTERGRGYYLLRIGLQGRRVHAEDRKDAVLTFVIDTSGSMSRENRLEMVKSALRMLVEELRPTDEVGIVAYGSQAWVVLEPTSVRQKRTILRAIDNLQTGGSTYAEQGLRMGYRMADRAFDEEAINRVILCSDGVANVGVTDAQGILGEIARYAGEEITLSTVGFGMGNYNDVLMEDLADKGNGNYAYVDTLDEAERIFVDDLTGTLQVIAKDAKIQVDFNPEVISRYRLLGYENRDVADEDFRDNNVDAGEVGAGHSVTALYEVKFTQDLGELAETGCAMTVHVRYEDPDTGEVVEVAQDFWPEDVRQEWLYASPEFQLAAAVAEYAEILRGSYWAKEGNLEDVLWLAQLSSADLAENELLGQDMVEFVELVGRAQALQRRD